MYLVKVHIKMLTMHKNKTKLHATKKIKMLVKSQNFASALRIYF